ncbi:MAG TPA: OmpA family protein [Candidatus Aquilonibacter sp.]|nr:OmpA family protein [Candidatus Aquilonibacter sp.]
MNQGTFGTALLLCAVFVFPLSAQQTSSSAQPAASADQNAAQSATAQDKESSQPSSRQDFWDGDDPSVVALIFHPFASKEYVRRHIQAVQDRVNELDELSVANDKMIKDVDARSQHGIQLASDKADLANTHATDATSKAQAAHESAAALESRLSTVEAQVGGIDQYKTGQQTEIRFRPGQTELSKPAKDALDQMAAQLKNQHGYIVEVQGFSSGQGQAAIASSRKMADSVVRYLVFNREVPAYRIYVIGMGNEPAAKGTSRTRVEVSVLRNDLEQAQK